METQFLKQKKYFKNGFSIIEMLVVISVFAVIGIFTTRAISLTLRSSKKSDSLVRVRENVNYSLSVLERQIRNSERISSCTGSPTSSISYTSVEGILSTFSCVTPGTSGYIASGSARLTSSDIAITSCSFTCTQVDANNPAVVKINVEAEDATSTSVEKGTVTAETEIIVRNY